MAMANSRASRALASLTRLSPSRMSTIRCGSPIRLAIEVAAMASVGATTAPRANPMRHLGHADHGEGDQTERQRKDADQVVGKLTPGNSPCGGIKKRRQNHEK